MAEGNMRLKLRLAATLFGVIMIAGVVGDAAAATPEDRVLILINKHRAKAGCAPLVIEARLMRAAKGHSGDMAERNFLAHQNPDGLMPVDRARVAGYPGGYIGENIAGGQQSASEVVAAWMRSPGHRAGILNCAFTQTGISVTKQGNDRPIEGNPVPYHTYWVNIFGRP